MTGLKWGIRMEYAVDSLKMKLIDKYTMEEIGIPSLVLMERAAMEVVAVMKQVIKKEDRVLVVCGPGNNGADGIAAVRILFLQGYQVAFLLTFDREKCSNEMQTQLAIAEKLGIKIDNSSKLREYNIIIDAIFGIGLSKPVTGQLADIIDSINKGNHKVFSVDIPSGISADNGKVLGTAIKADYTVTFGFMKQGLILYPGAIYAGKITVADIGFPDKALYQAGADTFFYKKEDLKYLPERKIDGHKGTFGKVLVIAGSVGMGGAAYLSALAAYRTGAGMVKIMTASENREIIQSLLPEALFSSYDSDGEVTEALSWADVIVIGPGLSLTDKAKGILNSVLEKSRVPIIIDADAINLMAQALNREGIPANERLKKLDEVLPQNTILTPHPMELSRLLDIPVSDVSDNIIDIANQCSYNSKLIYVLKNARTIVAGCGKKYINISGNSGMATAGSGDVLTGIVAGLIAQKAAPYEAACLAAFLHGLAGDAAAERESSYSMIARDIAEAIGLVLHENNL